MFHNCCRWRQVQIFLVLQEKFLNLWSVMNQTEGYCHGSSERNLTFVVLRSDLYKAMNALPRQSFPVAIENAEYFSSWSRAGWICFAGTYPGTTRFARTSLRTQLKLIDCEQQENGF